MIRTRIAQILGPTRFVLAAGADQGVQEGMEFIIYELSDTIYDPETNESLGQLELHKGRIKVIHVQEKMATATTLPRKGYRPPFGPSLGDALRMLREEFGEYEHLPIEQPTATAVKADLKVKVGDLVRSVE
jgi:hypothetical protein